MNQFLLVVILFTVAACATPSHEPNPPETRASEAVQPSEAARSYETMQSSESRHSPAAARAGDPDSDVLAHNNPANAADGIEDLEAPKASEIPAEMIPGRPTPEPAVVCEKVIPTGSVIPVKVCRNVEYAKQKEQADREIFDDIKRNTALGNSRL